MMTIRPFQTVWWLSSLIAAINSSTGENLKAQIWDSVKKEAKGVPLEGLTTDALFDLFSKGIKQAWSEIRGDLPENALEDWEAMKVASLEDMTTELIFFQELLEETESELKQFEAYASEAEADRGDCMKAAQTFEQLREKERSILDSVGHVRHYIESISPEEGSAGLTMQTEMRRLFTRVLINEWYIKCVKPVVEEMKELLRDILAKLPAETPQQPKDKKRKLNE